MDRTLRVMCASSMTAKVAMTLIGIAAATMSELGTWRRKNSSTKNVMTTPSSAVSERLPMDALMKSDWL